MEPKYVTYTEAARRLGIDRTILPRYVRRLGLTVYVNPRDMRQKLLDWDELDAAMRLRPASPAGARP